MSQPKTHTGVIVTKDGEKTVQIRETATTFRDTWNACLSEVVRMNAADIKVKG